MEQGWRRVGDDTGVCEHVLSDFYWYLWHGEPDLS